MDDPTAKTELAATEAFLLRAQTSVASQRKLIASMERMDYPTDMAMKILAGLENIVADARARRDATAARLVLTETAPPPFRLKT